MNRISKFSILALTLLLLGNLFLAGARTAVAQIESVAITSSTTEEGAPACWVAVGNRLYFIAKDDSTVLKVKASGTL